MHLENLNYDIPLYLLELQATCAHSVWRYAFEIAFSSAREFIISRNVCMQQAETQPTGWTKNEDSRSWLHFLSHTSILNEHTGGT